MKNKYLLLATILILLFSSTVSVSAQITGFQSADEQTSLPQIMEGVPSYDLEKNSKGFSGIGTNENELNCGLNTIRREAKEGYWTKNFCKEKEGNIFHFNPLKDGEERARKLCDTNKVSEKVEELYSTIKCPATCSVKKKIFEKSGKPITLCNPGILFGSTIHCSSNVLFNCEPQTVKQTPPEIKQIAKILFDASKKTTSSAGELTWRPPITPTHGISESKWLAEPPSTPEIPSSIAWRPPITPTHGISESNWLSQPPSAPPKETPIPGTSPTTTPKQSPTPAPSEPKSPKDPNSPCSLENIANQVGEALNDAKKHFDEMENPANFIGGLGPQILTQEIMQNFCKNPKMDLTEFLDFHVSEACDAVSTGSPKCREKIGKILACDEKILNELSEYGVDREKIRNICGGGRTKEELDKLTNNCIDLWEKEKEEIINGIHSILRSKCPPPDVVRTPTPEPTPTRTRDPTRTPVPEPTRPPIIVESTPQPLSCPPDMILVGGNKCVCPEGKVMVEQNPLSFLRVE
ncbi:MAG: hypothetical protein AABX39_00080, partial [Nanoarchaeota archaeon]